MTWQGAEETHSQTPIIISVHSHILSTLPISIPILIITVMCVLADISLIPETEGTDKGVIKRVLTANLR